MNFKSFFLVLTGMSFLGTSGGYVIGFYLHKVIPESDTGYWFYISVPIMALSSFMIMYGALFSNNRKNEKRKK